MGASACAQKGNVNLSFFLVEITGQKRGLKNQKKQATPCEEEDGHYSLNNTKQLPTTRTVDRIPGMVSTPSLSRPPSCGKVVLILMRPRMAGQ